MEDLRDFEAKMRVLAQMRGVAISAETLKVYLMVLKKHGLKNVNQALAEIIEDSPVTDRPRLPYPKEIIERFAPVGDDDSKAKDAAARVITAVSRFGSYSDSEKVREFVGEVGWWVITMQGGWESVCRELTYDNKPILQAQWRDLAKAAILRSRAGILSEPPRLPEPRKGGLLHVSEMTSKLLEKK